MSAQRAILARRVPPSDSPESAAQDLSGVLCGLLTSGGDDRLAAEPQSGANGYGCVPYPADDRYAFSSSTASSISAEAYAHVSHLLAETLAEGGKSMDAVLRGRVERLRAELTGILGLAGTGVGIVFSPSGTDAQLHALFLAGRRLGKPLTTITVGADQTGSGTAFTGKGQHFSARTARNRSVAKGAPIAGLSEGVAALALPLIDASGRARSESEIDAEVFEAVEGDVRRGRKVLLQAMNASKFGWRAPSDRCLDAIRERWPEAVQIVIDACQMRLGRQRIKAYLARGFIVLLTGSKFFTGPAFSGALLLPARWCDGTGPAATDGFGLEDYARQSDYPPCFAALRARLDAAPNPGQWLRWEAALQEMRRYYALPLVYRQGVLARLAEEIPALLRGSGRFEVLTAPPIASPPAFDDEEMSSPTIFPFLIKSGGGYLVDDAARVYRALRGKLPAGFPDDAAREGLRLADTVCHIGQPVKIPAPGGAPAAALRICIGARTLSQAWSEGHRSAGDCAGTILERIRTVVRKADLIAGHLDQSAASGAPRSITTGRTA